MRLLLLLAASFVLLAAQFSGPKPLAVAHCQPWPPGFSVSPAFVTGYYPPDGHFTWRDVYGQTYHQPPLHTPGPSLAVHFENVSAMALTEIEWGLVRKGKLIAEARDMGTFSPGEFRRRYGLNPAVFPINAIPHCIALHAQWKNGTTWTNPNLPPKEAPLFLTPPPAHPQTR
ncbi:MAG: hypothetical protein JO140_04095 [Candidatus Eremiobacteraeota bacterium]|nr:hypothetical protein [Candidatus Eremiobacteraeota bacterium]